MNVVIIKVLFVINKKETLYCNIYLRSPNDVYCGTEVEMCTVKTTPTTNTPIQSQTVTSKYNYASFLASVSNTLHMTFVWLSLCTVCSHQSIQSWTVVVIVLLWVLLMVGVAEAVILCIYKKGKCMHEFKLCIFHDMFMVNLILIINATSLNQYFLLNMRRGLHQ